MTEQSFERPAPGAPDFRYEEHQSVDSTNTLCFDRARAGHSGRLWVRADMQVSGRGRRGRDWSSPVGNLFASLLLVDQEPAERIGELPLVAAVALAEAVDKACGTHQLVSLKWPNDLLIDGAKLSGILLEAEQLTNGRRAVVLGFGVNCVAHPPLTAYRATDLRSLGFEVGADRLYESLAAAMAEKLEAWRVPGGFSDIRAQWLARSAHLGRQITVRYGQEEITGIFADLDERGHLVLKEDNGRERTIYAGDVFLPDK
ncbi:biotin--[acetyl-CoA-carboxylase] ligase [Rhodobacterales bacterium]|nr:biotin--[acetyl-CoA-carboxylase] ligase [Rhodobacterales bacterium]